MVRVGQTPSNSGSSALVRRLLIGPAVCRVCGESGRQWQKAAPGTPPRQGSTLGRRRWTLQDPRLWARHGWPSSCGKRGHQSRLASCARTGRSPQKMRSAGCWNKTTATRFCEKEHLRVSRHDETGVVETRRRANSSISLLVSEGKADVGQEKGTRDYNCAIIHSTSCSRRFAHNGPPGPPRNTPQEQTGSLIAAIGARNLFSPPTRFLPRMRGTTGSNLGQGPTSPFPVPSGPSAP
jgi:hypothetical protein